MQILRQFRDVYLLPSTIGKAFVEAYYRYSPPAANYIAGHDGLRAIVRVALLPVVGLGYLTLHAGPALMLLLVSLMLGLFAGIGMAVRRRIRG